MDVEFLFLWQSSIRQIFFSFLEERNLYDDSLLEFSTFFLLIHQQEEKYKVHFLLTLYQMTGYTLPIYYRLEISKTIIFFSVFSTDIFFPPAISKTPEQV